MRVGVVDIGTNSTRLLVADVDDGRVEEIERRSTVTRLGQGVDASGRLDDAAIDRVFEVLNGYREELDRLDCDATTGVLTSAVRDAANGHEFAEQVHDRYGFDARTIDGDTEAQLTFAGATAQRERDDDTALLVVDIGGGSTELVVGSGGRVSFHVSTQAGVVRQSERHLHGDPPAAEELRAVADDVRGLIDRGVPEGVRESAAEAIAVAGTPTSCAAIDLRLDPYDPARVEGHVLSLDTLEALLERLTAMPLDERREVTGLHPDRSGVIVPGIVILLEVMRHFGLARVTASEHDILWGAALERARRS